MSLAGIVYGNASNQCWPMPMLFIYKQGTVRSGPHEGGLGFLLIWKRSKRTGERLARFRQVHMDEPHVHHDALEFPNGEFVLLTRLCDGQFATVLQLPAAPRSAEESEQKKSTAAVG
jgi:hypothetical protein